MYGQYAGPREGECWMMKWGDQCQGGFQKNDKYDVVQVVNRSVTQEKELQMGLLAAGVAPFALPDIVAGPERSSAPERWVKEAVMGFRNWRDATALYRSNVTKKCVLAFGGTDDTAEILKVKDLLEADPDKTVPEVCGFKLNPFIVQETEKRLLSPVFQKFFLPVLSGKCVPDQITVVGHGLGGAVAETMAVCMNNNYARTASGWVQGQPPFVVKDIYTIGAPRIGNGEIKNGRGEKEPCFEGKRIYTEKDGLVEFVKSGASHPLMNAMELRENGENYLRTYSKTAYGCTHKAKERPQETPNFKTNLAEKYIFRMASMR